MKSFTTSLFLLCACLLSGCASIINGPRQDLTVYSNPTGAKLYIDGIAFGETPQNISLRRKGHAKGDLSKKKAYTVTIELPGYQPYEMEVKRKLNAWFFGNIGLGGLIGVVVDATNGSMYKLDNKQLVAELQRDGQQVSQNEEGIYIAVTLQADPSWEKVGELIPEE